MTKFQTTTSPPLGNQGGGGTPPSGGTEFHDQIHKMIEKGYSLDDIHKAIDGHPDMTEKQHYRDYAAIVHGPYTEHMSKNKKTDANKKDA